jgi:hypothetical protein
MIQILVGLVLFFLVLFSYIHIRFHLKTNNDLDVIDLTRENIGKDRFEEVCALISPFKFRSARIPFNFNDVFGKFDKYNVNLRKNKERVCLPIKLKDAIEFLTKEESRGYYSERNVEFISETLLNKEFEKDDYLKPPMSMRPKYDVIIGNKGTITPIQYKNDYRNYLVVCSGACRIRLFNPNSIKYLNIDKDYDTYEFSNITNDAFVDEMEKTQYIDVVLGGPGESLFIPPYWSYSVAFEGLSVIAQNSYNTPMSFLSVGGDLMRYIFQQQNVKTKI